MTPTRPGSEGPTKIPTVSFVNTSVDRTLIRTYLFAYIVPKGPNGRPDRAAIEAVMPAVREQLGILDVNACVAQRATFIVDPEGIIRFVYVTDLSVGRNPAEVLRVLDALQTDELCPCNWKQGDDTLKAA